MTLVHASVSSTNDSTLNRQCVGEPKTSCRVSKNIHSEEMELTQADKVPHYRVFRERKRCPNISRFFSEFASKTIQSTKTPKGKKLLRLAVVMLKANGGEKVKRSDRSESAVDAAVFPPSGMLQH